MNPQPSPHLSNMLRLADLPSIGVTSAVRCTAVGKRKHLYTIPHLVLHSYIPHELHWTHLPWFTNVNCLCSTPTSQSTLHISPLVHHFNVLALHSYLTNYTKHVSLGSPCQLSSLQPVGSAGQAERTWADKGVFGFRRQRRGMAPIR